jgi:hypothetical protein
VGFQSSLIQIIQISERPRIVPPEVLLLQRSYTNSLAETQANFKLDEVASSQMTFFLHSKSLFLVEAIKAA